MRIVAIVSLILFSTLAFKAVAVSCEISTTKDRFGNPRIFKIHFPDGRKISVVGQHHTDRNVMWEMLHFPANKDLFARVRDVLRNESTAKALPLLIDERELVRQAVKDGAEFIGVELAHERVRVWSSKIHSFQERMLKYSAQNNISDVSLISTARLAAYGAPLAMQFEEPALFKKAPLYGIEDREAVKSDNEASDVLRNVVADAENEIGNDTVWRDKLDALHRDMLLEHYPVHNPDAPKEDFIKSQLSQWPGKYRSVIRKVIFVYVNYFDLLYARDSLSSENILNKNSSGIVFIGAAHAQPLMLRLREACLKQQLQGEDLTSAIPAKAHR